MFLNVFLKLAYLITYLSFVLQDHEIELSMLQNFHYLMDKLIASNSND